MGRKREGEKLVQTGVFITERQRKWLREHNEINFSGWVREKLGRMIEERKRENEV